MSVAFFANKWVRIAAILLFLGAASVPSVYFYRKYQIAQRQIANPAELSQAQTKELIDAIGKLIELPPDEQPTIATVTDAEKLRNQNFFMNAQNGDRVLIYTTAKKAILYRPSINKIIEVAPVNIGQSATTSAQPSVPTATPTSRPTLTPTPTQRAK